MLPDGNPTTMNRSMEIKGTGDYRMKIPLHKIYVRSKWREGTITNGVVDELPMAGILMSLGNDIVKDKLESTPNEAFPVSTDRLVKKKNT